MKLTFKYTCKGGVQCSKTVRLRWLRERTGSIWAPSLAHAATNSIGGSLTLLLFMGELNWIFVGYLGPLGWIPLGALCSWLALTRRLRPIKEASQGNLWP